MSDLINQLREPELHYTGNFDTVKRANAMLMCMCQEAADALEAQAARIKELESMPGCGWSEQPQKETYVSCRIESQAKEIAELRELNLAQIKTIRTLQTKASYYKEISEDMGRELDGNSN